jgi:Flp pilus assembly protein TadD
VLYLPSGNRSQLPTRKVFNVFSKLLSAWRLYAAESAHARGNHRKAVSLFSLLINDSKNSESLERRLWTLYLHRGMSLRATGCHEEALRDYERSAQLNPRSHKPHLNAGIILGQDLGRHREALAEFEKAVSLDVNDVESLMSVALTKYELGDMDGAERVFRRALKMDPGNWLVLYNLGNVCLNTNRISEAIDLFARARQANPNDPDIAHNLAIARSRLGLE